VWLLAATSGCSSRTDPFETPWPGQPPEPRIEIVIDFTRARDGRVPVSMRLTGVKDDEFRFRLRGNEGEYQVHDARFTDSRGRAIKHERRGLIWDLAPFEGNVVQAHYEAQPGGIGRHGAQGGVAGDWALFDGRLYLSPKNMDSLRAARFRFLTPDGWNVASPFRKDGDWYYLDMFAPENTPRLLEKSCVGVGRFEQSTRRMGDMEVRVASYAGWSDEHKQKLAASTFKVVEYFHDTLGFDLRAPYSVVWAPRFKGQKIFGGSFVNGTCFAHNDYSLRAFELLAHRMGHSMNKYPPAGMAIRDARDRWFREGWASYIEVTATQATGIAELEQRPSWDSLYDRYKKGRTEHPEWDIPLIDEPSADGDTEEFIHYRKGPLVTKMLANWIEWRSDRTMEQFMRAIWAKYGRFRGAFPVQQDLEEFTGVSFEDFWVTMIDRQSVVVPAWDGYLTDQIRDDMQRPPAARVGGEPLSGDYLHYLARCGDFRAFHEVRDFLIAEQTRRRDLAAREVQLYPGEVRDHLFALPPEDRYAVARLEASYPLEFAPQSVRSVGRPVRLLLDRGDEDGRVFAALLELDRRELSSVSAGELSGLQVRVVGGTRAGDAGLGFALNSRLELRPTWRSEPGHVDIELLQEGQVLKSWTVHGESEQPVAKVGLNDRLEQSGIIAFRVRSDGQPPITRVYWQRGMQEEQRLGAADAPIQDLDDPQAWFLKGIALSATGRNEEALEAFATSAALDSGNAAKWIKHGQTLAQLNRHEEAIVSFDKALGINPKQMAASGNRAVSLAKLGRRTESLTELESFMADRADAPSRFLWKGQVLEGLGDLDQAVGAYRDYIAALPKRPEGWLKLGQGLAGLERYEESIAAYEKALALNPRSKPAAAGRRQALEALARRS
jgi:Tfp pilus assembly protein PilF